MTPEFIEPLGSELVIVSAADDAALVASVDNLIDFLNRVRTVSLLDVAYTCSLTTGPARIAFIASSTEELLERLRGAKSRLESPTTAKIRDKGGVYYFRNHLLGEGKGKLAFVYPGVFSFYPDMLRDLALLHPECRTPFDELEEAMAGDPDFTPSNFIFPPAQYYRKDADIFSSGAYAQALVSVFAASASLTRLLTLAGLSPDGVVGCAGGDLAAAMRSGATGTNLPRPDRVKVFADIYRIVDKAVDHEGLPSVSVVTMVFRREGDAEEVMKTFPEGKVMLALDFSSRNKTYAVVPEFEDEMIRAFSTVGGRMVKKLALNRPFNTPWCEKIVPALKKFAGLWIKSEPECDVYSCALAERLSEKPRIAREETAERWAKPVRFTETIRRMYEDGYRVFLEVGPRGLMTPAVEDILDGREFAAFATNSIHRRGVLQLQHALAQLTALGADLDLSRLLGRRGGRKIDFDSTFTMISMEVAAEKVMPLSRLFPKLSLLGDEKKLIGAEFLAEPKGRGAKAQQRAAVLAEKARKQRQFDFGAVYPLVSDATELKSSPGVSCEYTKEFYYNELPFLMDFAYGNSQLSYSDPNLRGLVLLSLPVGAEIMAETARRVMPSRSVVAIEDFSCRRMVQFEKGKLALFIRAERVAWSDPKYAAVKVQIRDDAPNSVYTWPIMEATVLLAAEIPETEPAQVDSLSKPRAVHWSGREIYPSKLGFGKRLRGIVFAEAWGENGLDYEVAVPDPSDSLSFTRFPLWEIDPLLLQTVVSGFLLWRSHDRFPGAFSYPFRIRRLELKGQLPSAGTRLNCYLRLSGVTPKSHISDITVTAGNGNTVMEISGWEEITSRIPKEYCNLVLQPASSFITETISPEALGNPATDVASAFITDVPYPMFERDEEFWLKILSHVVLNARERRDFHSLKGSTARRTEWLFGRIVAKEAVRRFLRDCYQARWSYADVDVWKNDKGKPIAIGAWKDNFSTDVDVGIAHTAQFVVAVVAANMRVGIDVESVSRDLSEEFTKGVFCADELEFAAQAPNAAQAVIRFWCAKEAVSKALGTGIRWSPREMKISGYESDTGRILVRLEDDWVANFKKFTGRDIEVTSRIIRDHAFASCFIPTSMFVKDSEDNEL